MPEALDANCGNHSTAAAVATCRRCGLFLCDACLVLDGDESYCATCLERRQSPPSFLARASVFAPVAALLCAATVFAASPLSLLWLGGTPLWLFGVVANLTERRRLKGEEALRARRWLRAGALTSAVGVLALAPMVLVVVELLAHRHHHH